MPFGACREFHCVDPGIHPRGAHYVTTKETSGTDISELTNIDVAYLFEVGDAVVGPEYRVVSTQDTADGVKGEKWSDSFALFGMSMEF